MTRNLLLAAFLLLLVAGVVSLGRRGSFRTAKDVLELRSASAAGRSSSGEKSVRRAAVAGTFYPKWRW